jgi:type II secretory pathway predicted ATPase ExeA
VLSVILLGQPELSTVLAKTSVREVGARIEPVVPGCLSIEDGEVRKYIGHRLCLARLERPPVEEPDYNHTPFDESAIAAVEMELSGVPHGAPATFLAINAICSHALHEAVDQGADTVDEDIVHEARKKMLGGV